VLNAGNFGVPQSRKRTFIWAAAPEELLPAWPRPRHVFRTPQLTINLPGGVQYTAVPQLPGAPCRSVTVREAIKDLPAIENGESK
jgi:DNA (cytosine-5)-methyltransferase 1